MLFIIGSIFGLIYLPALVLGDNEFIFPPYGGPGGVIVGDSNLTICNWRYSTPEVDHRQYGTNLTSCISRAKKPRARLVQYYAYRLYLVKDV